MYYPNKEEIRNFKGKSITFLALRNGCMFTDEYIELLFSKFRKALLDYNANNTRPVILPDTIWAVPDIKKIKRKKLFSRKEYEIEIKERHYYFIWNEKIDSTMVYEVFRLKKIFIDGLGLKSN